MNTKADSNCSLANDGGSVGCPQGKYVYPFSLWRKYSENLPLGTKLTAKEVKPKVIKTFFFFFLAKTCETRENAHTKDDNLVSIAPSPFKEAKPKI